VAWAAIRLLAGLTFEVAATTGGYVAEPAMWIGTTLLLIGLTLTACYIPARKSLRVDPVISLRQE
jgi:ABC-type antimicrobial peptide transport system permease subunit